MDTWTERNFEYLARMIRKYAHCWGENPSDRLRGWVAQYDEKRQSEPEVFALYCEYNGLDKTHNAGDLLA